MKMKEFSKRGSESHSRGDAAACAALRCALRAPRMQLQAH
jgi:hypothetical protein